jgi:hypothetical protein
MSSRAQPRLPLPAEHLRDALVAALNAPHLPQARRPRAMANIAQTVNVLQAMILTDKEKMLLTPTYHVFEMFKVHQGDAWRFHRGDAPDAGERVTYEALKPWILATRSDLIANPVQRVEPAGSRAGGQHRLLRSTGLRRLHLDGPHAAARLGDRGAV